MRYVHAVYCCFFLLRISCPGNGYTPVEMRLHGVAVFVFNNFVEIVTYISRICQPFANDGITYPENKLLVLRVGNFGFVHPEIIHRNASGRDAHPPQRIYFAGAHLVRASGDKNHIVGRGLTPHFPHGNTRQFASNAASDTSTGASDNYS
ncbi:MAG: hypothetical protein BWZ00_01265 [Bacteroidetes bacterium ADurb.BinA174]|nr:MAG: hypothetical protein BWZ00_01265 [Bacteroidetes bacterium ADurb.BinA174]